MKWISIPSCRSNICLYLLTLLILSLSTPVLFAQQEDEEEEESVGHQNSATSVDFGGEFNPWDEDGVMAPGVVTETPFRHLYLSGKVVLEDGSPPPASSRIELVCADGIQPQAITDDDGSFNFRVSHSRNRELVNSSAARALPGTPVGGTGYGSDNTRPAYLNMSDCYLRAALGGYRSSKVTLGRRSVFEATDIGPVILYPLGQSQQPFLNRLDSVQALKHFEKGKEELGKDKPDAEKASGELVKAVEADPDFAAAWNLLGESRIRLGDLEGARAALTEAISTDSAFVAPCVTLALLELKEGNVAEAATASEKAVRLAPNLAEARYYHGIASANQGKIDAAKDSFETVLKSPDSAKFPRTHYLLGAISAQSGELEKAVSHFRQYLELEPDSKVAELVKKQLEEWADQGVI